MAEYENVKKTKLILKGAKPDLKRKKKHSHKRAKGEKTEVDADVVSHGGWCKSVAVNDVIGSVCIEFGTHTYVKALDNGCFTIGPPHSEGEGPSPEEILTAVVINEQKIALKSGYGKYLGYSKDGCVTGKADAIGPLEHWEPIFQDNKVALLSSNGCFMSVRDSDDTVVVTSRKASDKEFVEIRYMATVKEKDPLTDVPTEERGDVSEIEVNYVRKFQKFQDKKLKISGGSKLELDKAKTEGYLHETLLDRRSKMKADRYCK